MRSGGGVARSSEPQRPEADASPRWGHGPIADSRTCCDAGLDRRGEALSGPIVYGVDGSPDSQAALEIAARLAGRLELTLIAADVMEPVVVPRGARVARGAAAEVSTLRPLRPRSRLRAGPRW